MDCLFRFPWCSSGVFWCSLVLFGLAGVHNSNIYICDINSGCIWHNSVSSLRHWGTRKRRDLSHPTISPRALGTRTYFIRYGLSWCRLSIHFRLHECGATTPALNSGQWSQYERRIRDYAVNHCTKDDGTLYLLTGSSFVHWIPHIDHFMAKKPSKASKLADEDLSQVPVITIPSSLWTAGCCVRGGTAAGNFAVFGANAEDPREQ